MTRRIAAAGIDELDGREIQDEGIYQRSVGVYGAGLDARGGAGDAIELIAESVVKIVDIIKQKVKEDKLKREQFTQETVANGRSQHPDFNWVICHVKHTTNFAGTQGKDWGHSHHEVDIQIGGTIGYEIYWFKSGTFSRQGDGGYMNWAWSGYSKEVTNNGANINFNAPP
ncbi:hypothetical protein P691DRAFT_675036 [Macrolepiota fuliginosa MF-IS2]|uniref:DUF7888 domain-containing protein n=1 Tax=Macrolepiota fuliginosa MF-IS2 TaxID=1400762 RepID=A0A9P5X713_9AGAR|nr:hypothetical protein P691DRAFT_675036 [Macrolepiota fuliginosa MF-IS2]